MGETESLNSLIQDIFGLFLFAGAMLLFRPVRNSRRFSRAFREKSEFYYENPISQR